MTPSAAARLDLYLKQVGTLAGLGFGCWNDASSIKDDIFDFGEEEVEEVGTMRCLRVAGKIELVEWGSITIEVYEDVKEDCERDLHGA